jgi:hypothetical protein
LGLSGEQQVTPEKIEVYRALGGANRQDNREISYIDVANQAAAHGWEMLTIHYRDIGSEIVFKRPVR